MKNKMLENICTFADECGVSNYGAFPICCQDYVDCEEYQKIIARRIEAYNEENRIEVLK